MYVFHWKQNIGALNVYTRTTYGGQTKKIFSKDYEVGDFWSRADLPIIIAEPFQILLEAIVGNGYAGDIAIDDTSFTPGCVLANIDLVTVTTPSPSLTTPNPCTANKQFQCVENGQCIDMNKVCDFKVDCPTPGGSDEANCGTCTFDDNNGTSCGWKDFSYGELKWSLTTGSTYLGPSSDHTTGSGFYMFVPNNEIFGFSSMRSPPVGPSGVECQLQFWYYMDFDEKMGYSSVAIYQRKETDGFNSFYFISNIIDSTGPQWKQATVNIGYQSQRFLIGIDI